MHLSVGFLFTTNVVAIYSRYVLTWFSRFALMFQVDRMSAVLVGQQRVSCTWHEDNSFINAAFVLLPSILCRSWRKPTQRTCQLHADDSHRPTGLELYNFTLLNDTQDWTINILHNTPIIPTHAPFGTGHLSPLVGFFRFTKTDHRCLKNTKVVFSLLDVRLESLIHHHVSGLNPDLSWVSVPEEP